MGISMCGRFWGWRDRLWDASDVLRTKRFVTG
jgi:hypothetical protein